MRRFVWPRLSALLGAQEDSQSFRTLFNMRSEYLHGRQMSSISTAERMLARRLARRTVQALYRVALETPALSSRETYLDALLDAGLGVI